MNCATLSVFIPPYDRRRDYQQDPGVPRKRDWAQFHTPKDMAEAVCIEASELLEHFLWKGPKESQEVAVSCKEEISDEMADIAIYLFELADNLNVDLLQAMQEKLAKNA